MGKESIQIGSTVRVHKPPEDLELNRTWYGEERISRFAVSDVPLNFHRAGHSCKVQPISEACSPAGVSENAGETRPKERISK
jgi:hypothetical protein